ncbi:hypothetical protein QFC21_006564 [Naganishia friedmannii]|uniref:Uncharacterized protein n=1 Tax=Naganishia friedmannii TaxID=89922 RepID=A0ACC2V365_9TREE|nr:hypothetical protein QFC21_006564 [Naganishia friedmannii]
MAASSSLHAHFQEALQVHDGPTTPSGTMSPHTSGAIPFSRPASPAAVMRDQLAFVGLGQIGKWCALNLARSLDEDGKPPLMVWNRGSEGLELFKAHADKEDIPYVVADNLEQIAQKADIVLASLGNDKACEEVFGELFKGWEKAKREKSTIFVDMSTVGPATADKLERTCSSVPNRHFLSAPVFGPPPLAKSAGLVMAMAGQYHAKKRVSHAICPAMVRKVMDLGSDVERAAKFKLTGNAMVLGCMELLAETMTLADQSGVGAEKLYELIQEFFPAPSFIGYGKKMLADNFKADEGFSLQGGIKDASHIRKLGEDCSVPLPIIDIAHQHLITARATGGGHLDWSSLVAGERIAAGLPPFKRHLRLERYD